MYNHTPAIAYTPRAAAFAILPLAISIERDPMNGRAEKSTNRVLRAIRLLLGLLILVGAGAALALDAMRLPDCSPLFVVESALTAQRKAAQPFHRTLWFYALCADAVVAILWILYFIRLRAVRLRHEAVLAERSRIARDFHDTMAQTLTGLSLQLEGAIRSLDDPQRAREHLEKAKILARGSLTDTRRMLFNLRPTELERQDLTKALQHMVELMTDGLPVRGTLVVNGEPRRLSDARVETQLLHIAQEAVTNALRHARARKIEIVIDFEPERIRLAIRDDGRGSGKFTLDELATSTYGVRGMRERADDIGGIFTVRPSHGQGIEIAVEVPA